LQLHGFEEESIITVRPVKKSVDAVFGRLYDKDRRSLSTEEIDEVVRRQINKEYGGKVDESA